MFTGSIGGRQITSAARSQSLSTFSGRACERKPLGKTTSTVPVRIADDVPIGNHQAVLIANVDERAAAVGDRVVLGNDDAGDGRMGRHCARCRVEHGVLAMPLPGPQRTRGSESEIAGGSVSVSEEPRGRSVGGRSNPQASATATIASTGIAANG